VEGGQSEIIQSSMAGEGAPVAVAAAMLIGLGFRPLLAAVVCLVANTPPVPFGPVGVPTSMMISVTNLNGTVITKTIGSDMAILALVIPFLVLAVVSGFKRTLEVWPAALVTGFSYAVTCFVVSHYFGVELPAIISAFVSMVCLIVFLRFWRPKQIWQFAYDSNNSTRAKTQALAYAMSLPVATTISGMDSMEVLDQNLTILRDFKTLSVDPMQILRDQGRNNSTMAGTNYTKAPSSTTGILAAASTVIPHRLNCPFE
jgi:L-lactate permease